MSKCFCHFNGLEVKDATARRTNAEHAEQIEQLDSRVNNLTANNGEQTEGNAELIDIRVGADGATYATAGEAVRTQFANVKSDLSDVNEAFKLNNIPQYYVKERGESTVKEINLNTNADCGLPSNYFKNNDVVSIKNLNSYNINVYGFHGATISDGYDSLGQTSAGNTREYHLSRDYYSLHLQVSDPNLQLAELKVLLGKNLSRNVIPLSHIGAKITKAILNVSNLKIKCIGDSITAGVGGTGYNDTESGGGELIYDTAYTNVNGVCWVSKLKNYVQRKSSSISVKNFGVSGITSYTILSHYDDLVKADDDIIICMIGTNDRTLSLASYYNRMTELVKKLLKDGKEVVLMSSIPAKVSNEANGTKLFHMEDVDNVINLVANECGVEYISIFKEFSDYCMTTNTSLDTLLTDEVHPNNNGYELMYRIILHKLGLGIKTVGATW